MFKSKIKGLFVDLSEFSILAARTSAYTHPIEVEEIAELPLLADVQAEDVRAFLEQLVDFNGAEYYVSRCGVYPRERFLHYYESSSVNKLKDLNFLTEVLESKFKVDPATTSVSILDARSGANFDPEAGLTKQIIFCGGSVSILQEVQDQLLSYGLYPDRLELSSMTTLGGVCDYACLNQIMAPILCVELTSQHTNVFVVNNAQVALTSSLSFGLDDIYLLLQRELGLKDEASARKLFYSNTFDFAEIGSKLLRRIIKELQATAGLYEVQTGLGIACIFLSALPQNLSWIAKSMSDSLGIEIMQPNMEAWLQGLNIKFADGVDVSNLGSRWFSVFSLMAEFQSREGVSE